MHDSVEDVRNLGLSNGQPSVLVIVFRQPGANIIDTIDSVKAALPHLQAAMPADVNVTVAIDRSTTIRDSLRDTELTLLIAISLVTLVVFVFLRNFRATLIPGIAVPISILGTFGGMYLLGYSLDILSLMALTIATGFVVDDAIVVLENISRHLEEGMPRVQAALRGAQEVGFTVLSISLSLIAVFIPILLMGGILGRLFREFTITLSIAILISLAISLTTTPMMCALWLKPREVDDAPRPRTLFDRVHGGYEHSLGLGVAPRRTGDADPVRRGLPERRAVHPCAQGPVSDPGHRPPDRLAAGRSKRVVPGDDPEAAADDRYRAERPRRGPRRRIYRGRLRRRRRPDQYRFGIRFAKADHAAAVGR